MKRKYAEVDETGTVVDIHEAETKGNKGKDADEPRTKINTKKASHKTIPSQAANKGDKVIGDKLYRPLVKRAK